MKVSVNTIRFVNQQYASAGDPAPHGVEELVEKIGNQLGAVEEVIPYGERFKGVLVARVVSCIEHPNADRLHVCMLDDGGRATDVERNEQGLVQVVCGAPNVCEGIKVAWLPPGVTVPDSYGKEPFVLEARPLRGVMSNGMLASPRELTIGDSHDGILEVDADVPTGTSFSEAYNLDNEVIIDMENKMFTHRPDCFGMLGIAREIEGIYHRQYKSPEWYKVKVDIPAVEAQELKLEVRNEIPELVPRFTAIIMSGVDIKPSPVWLQIYLSQMGVKSINNIVDYTNLFMLETGQPLHAYDYDKVVAQDEGASHATIVIRKPQPGEKIALLNGKEIEPRTEAIMIATTSKLIGVGGVMGGSDTEVDSNTKNIIIEAANFDMYSIRRTSMAHGLFTDAVTRFNKGQSPLQTKAVLAKIVDEIRQYANGKVASNIIDDNHLSDEVMERESVYPAVSLDKSFVNTRLGFDLSAEDMAQLLRNVEFNVQVNGDELIVKAPFWRTDIAIPEDIVEEVGRLYGFDHLPLELPQRSLMPVQKDEAVELKASIRDSLARKGANELLTYTFVHGNLLDKVGQDKSQAFSLSNALSPDLQYYRLSLTPSLLDKVQPNVRAGYDRFALFELNKVHNRHESDSSEPTVPKEAQALAFVFAADDKRAAEYAGAPFYQAKKYLEELLAEYGVSDFVTYEPLQGADLYDNKMVEQMVAPYVPNRSAVLRDKQGLIWGVVGEFTTSIHKALKLPAYISGFEIDPLLLLQGSKGKLQYKQLPRFPKVTQDITLRVSSEAKQGDVYEALMQFIANHQDADAHYAEVLPVTIYQGDDTSTKNLSFRIVIASYERTLTDDEINKLLDEAADAAKEQFGAERI